MTAVKVTPAQRKVLVQLSQAGGRGSTYGTHSRTLGILLKAGLITSVGIREYSLTDAGRTVIRGPK